MANPVTHLEKTIAGEVRPVTHLEHVIAEYGGGNVYENLEAGTNILIEETSDGKAKISASGEISSEDTVARADIAAIKDGETLDSFGDVETALATKANAATTQSQIAWNANHGVKNMATENTFTATLRKTLTIAGELTGKITVSMSDVTSTDTDDTRCRILFEYKDGGTGGDVFCQRNVPYKQYFDIGTHILDKITIYASDNYAHSSGDTLTVTELMVKPTDIGDDTFQPYAPSNAELYEMIKALQS